MDSFVKGNVSHRGCDPKETSVGIAGHRGAAAVLARMLASFQSSPQVAATAGKLTPCENGRFVQVLCRADSCSGLKRGANKAFP